MTTSSANGQPAPETLSVVVRDIEAPPTPAGVRMVAAIDCPSLGIECAVLLFNPRANEIALVAPCGCNVHVELSRLIAELGQSLQLAHHGAQQPAAHLH